MAQLDRTKHAFDVLEHVCGGVRATTAEEDGPLVTPIMLEPEAITGWERETEIVILEGRG